MDYGEKLNSLRELIAASSLTKKARAIAATQTL